MTRQEHLEAVHIDGSDHLEHFGVETDSEDGLRVGKLRGWWRWKGIGCFSPPNSFAMHNRVLVPDKLAPELGSRTNVLIEVLALLQGSLVGGMHCHICAGHRHGRKGSQQPI